jgi:hypothetical protein
MKIKHISYLLGPNSSSALVAANYLGSNGAVEFARLLEDVRSLHTKQTSLSDKLSYLQTENEALWGEIGSLRQKHSKQQQIVSKLMEFLLNLVTNNSTHIDGQSVEQQPPNEGMTSDLFHSQQGHTQHHTLNEQVLSPNTLKRKHAALMPNNEPNKRTTMQQQQQQFSNPTNVGRQQSVTINELADNDAGGWLNAHTSPLIDLVPSPPPPIQTADDNYPQQQNEYQWPTSTNEFQQSRGQEQRNLPQQNQTFRTVGNGNNVANPYVPDFVLRSDNPSGTNIGQGVGTNLTGIKTVIIKIDCLIQIFAIAIVHFAQ